MQAVIYEHFYRKAAEVYQAQPIDFHKITLPSPPPPVTEIESSLLKLQHRTQARVIVINTQPISDSFLRNLKKNSLLIRYGAGYDNIPLARCKELGIHTAYTPEDPTHATVEFTLGIMLALTRKIHYHHNNLLAGKWDVSKHQATPENNPPPERLPQNHFTHSELRGKNLTIIGAGRIGTQVAKICNETFHMNITVVTKKSAIPPKPSPNTNHWTYTSDLKAGLRTADIVSIHAPLTPLTENLLNSTTLEYLKPTALLINTARGKICDEAAIFKKLKNQTLGGAALDVFTKEPYPHIEKLQTVPNLLLTPHQGGNTQEANIRIAKTIVANIRAFYQEEFDKITYIPASHTL